MSRRVFPPGPIRDDDGLDGSVLGGLSDLGEDGLGVGNVGLGTTDLDLDDGLGFGVLVFLGDDDTSGRFVTESLDVLGGVLEHVSNGLGQDRDGSGVSVLSLVLVELIDLLASLLSSLLGSLNDDLVGSLLRCLTILLLGGLGEVDANIVTLLETADGRSSRSDDDAVELLGNLNVKNSLVLKLLNLGIELSASSINANLDTGNLSRSLGKLDLNSVVVAELVDVGALGSDQVSGELGGVGVGLGDNIGGLLVLVLLQELNNSGSGGRNTSGGSTEGDSVLGVLSGGGGRASEASLGCTELDVNGAGVKGVDDSSTLSLDLLVKLLGNGKNLGDNLNLILDELVNLLLSLLNSSSNLLSLSSLSLVEESDLVILSVLREEQLHGSGSSELLSSLSVLSVDVLEVKRLDVEMGNTALGGAVLIGDLNNPSLSSVHSLLSPSDNKERAEEVQVVEGSVGGVNDFDTKLLLKSLEGSHLAHVTGNVNGVCLGGLSGEKNGSLLLRSRGSGLLSLSRCRHAGGNVVRILNIKSNAVVGLHLGGDSSNSLGKLLSRSNDVDNGGLLRRNNNGASSLSKDLLDDLSIVSGQEKLTHGLNNAVLVRSVVGGLQSRNLLLDLGDDLFDSRLLSNDGDRCGRRAESDICGSGGGVVIGDNDSVDRLLPLLNVGLVGSLDEGVKRSTAGDGASDLDNLDSILASLHRVWRICVHIPSP
jgi:hypothetical protein